MPEEKNLTNETGVVEDMTPDYLAAIQELKQNSVDRSKYDELRAENKKLLQSIVNGQQVEVEEPKPKKDIDELRKEWLDENNNNLQTVTKALELREALIAEGKPDPFLPIGSQITPEESDIAAANKVASVLRECVDYAEGNNDVFTNELQRRLIEVRPR